MIEETATVIAVEGEFALLETARKSVCGSCEVRKGCGTGAMSRFFGNRVARVQALNQVQAQPGDEVRIGIDERSLVKGSVAVYIAPLAALIGSALAVELLAGMTGVVVSEGITIIVALAGFLLALLWVRDFGQRIRHDARYQPVVLGVVSRSGNALTVSLSH